MMEEQSVALAETNSGDVNLYRRIVLKKKPPITTNSCSSENVVVPAINLEQKSQTSSSNEKGKQWRVNVYL
jgi:hypothetical protein